MVDWALPVESAVGSAVGDIGCGIAVRAPSGAGVGIDRSSSRRDYTLEGLAASRLCSDSLCSHRCDRRIPLTASDHETDIEGAYLGFDIDSHNIWLSSAVLGSIAGTAAVGGHIRLSISNDENIPLSLHFSNLAFSPCSSRKICYLAS